MIHARKDYNRIQDPIHKIPEDEPVFLIRAQDKVSAAAIRAWAELNEVVGGSRELSDAAYEHAFLMEEWQENNGCKVADLPDVKDEVVVLSEETRAEVEFYLFFGCKVKFIARILELPVWAVREVRAKTEEKYDEWWE